MRNITKALVDEILQSRNLELVSSVAWIILLSIIENHWMTWNWVFQYWNYRVDKNKQTKLRRKSALKSVVPKTTFLANLTLLRVCLISGLTDSYQIARPNNNWRKRFSVKLWLQTSESSENYIKSGIHYLKQWQVPWIVNLCCGKPGCLLSIRTPRTLIIEHLSSMITFGCRR